MFDVLNSKVFNNLRDWLGLSSAQNEKLTVNSVIQPVVILDKEWTPAAVQYNYDISAAPFTFITVPIGYEYRIKFLYKFTTAGAVYFQATIGGITAHLTSSQTTGFAVPGYDVLLQGGDQLTITQGAGADTSIPFQVIYEYRRVTGYQNE